MKLEANTLIQNFVRDRKMNQTIFAFKNINIQIFIKAR